MYLPETGELSRVLKSMFRDRERQLRTKQGFWYNMWLTKTYVTAPQMPYPRSTLKTYQEQGERTSADRTVYTAQALNPRNAFSH